MKDTSFHNFFLLRRPLLSSEVLFEFNNDTIQDPGQFNDQILSIYRSEKLQQAIFLASTTLYDSLMQILAGDVKSDIDQVCKSLYKYLIRMCTRCTPFGTLAGFTTGEISAEPTQISFEQSDYMHLNVDLSFDVYHSICEAISKREHIFTQLTFSVNTSLHDGFDSYHYIRRDGKNGGVFTHTQIQSNPYLKLVLTASPRKLNYPGLQEILTGNGLSIAQADSFISELYDAQILTSDLQVGAMVSNQIKSLTEKLIPTHTAQKEIKDLSEISQILRNEKTFSARAADTNRILNNYIPDQIKENPFRVNALFKEEHCNINQDVISTLQEELQELMPLAAAKVRSPLDEFCEAFTSRYGQRQVPLIRALDPHTGIAYGNKSLSDADSKSLLEKLTFPFASQNSVSNIDLEKLKLDLYEKALTSKRQSIELTSKDLSRLSSQTLPSTEGFYILGNLLSSGGKEADKGEFSFIHKAMGGPSAFNLMSRFCTTDHVLDGQVSQSTSWEELSNPEKIFAEINHVPDYTSANILSRGQLRKYELTYLSASSKKHESNIDLSDLFISVPDGKRVILYSKRHGKQVCPRLTSAHNFSDGLPIYRFLCDLAQQDCGPMLNWEWGNLSQRSFLPRITYKHFILSPSLWNIDKNKIQSNSKEFSHQIWKGLRTELDIPRYVQIIRGDQHLLIDNDNLHSSQILIDAINGQGKVKLCEYLEQPGRALISTENRTYCNEIIIPFLNNLPCERSIEINEQNTLETRSYPIGHEWLYLKIYLPVAVSDNILTNLVTPFCEEMESAKMIDKWFFIRYDDPDHHIRLRLHHGQGQYVSAHILSRFAGLAEPYFTSGLICKFTSDTYERELERYAGINYSITESLFHLNSKTVLNFLANCDQESSTPKWHAAILGVDMILEAVGLDLPQKSSIIEKISASFFIEFGKSDTLLYELNNQYRTNRKTIQALFDSNCTATTIGEFRLKMQSEMVLYKNLSKNICCQRPGGQYISSVIHMFLNRLFSSNHRKLELVIYHYMKKYYKSLYFRLDKYHHVEIKLQN